MATIHYGKDKEVYGIANLKLRDSDDGKTIIGRYTTFTGSVGEFKIPKGKFRLRVLSENSDIQELKVLNSCVIYGNVDDIKVGNCLFNEGNVLNFPSNGHVDLDRDIKVCHGSEFYLRHSIAREYSSIRTLVIKISGKLMNLSVNVSNIELETVIIGNCASVDCSNCAQVRGIIQHAKAGNRIYSTCGKSKAESIEVIKKRRKKAKEESAKILSSLFK